tara:strand:+ start:186 stop:413 length:228 start_codon:yes stop_codon:yes gene_type:complete
MNKLRGTYQRVEKEYTLSVDYTYYWDTGDYDHPPDGELDVTEIYIDSETLPLQFYYDFLEHQLVEDICEHAHDNR